VEAAGGASYTRHSPAPPNSRGAFPAASSSYRPRLGSALDWSFPVSRRPSMLLTPVRGAAIPLSHGSDIVSSGNLPSCAFSQEGRECPHVAKRSAPQVDGQARSVCRRPGSSCWALAFVPEPSAIGGARGWCPCGGGPERGHAHLPGPTPSALPFHPLTRCRP
jgi:hypothetical protein